MHQQHTLHWLKSWFMPQAHRNKWLEEANVALQTIAVALRQQLGVGGGLSTHAHRSAFSASRYTQGTNKNANVSCSASINALEGHRVSHKKPSTRASESAAQPVQYCCLG